MRNYIRICYYKIYLINYTYCNYHSSDCSEKRQIRKCEGKKPILINICTKINMIIMKYIIIKIIILM